MSQYLNRSENNFFMESISLDDTLPLPDYDTTLPLPTEVEQAFHDNAGDGMTALAWLADHGIDSVPERAALIQYGMVWNPVSGRYDFKIYAADHIGPKRRPALA